MPDLRDIIERKIKRLESVPDKFISNVDKAERSVYSKMIELLNALKLDKNGNVIRSKANLARVEEIVKEMKKVLYGSDYIQAVSSFAKEFTVQKNINNEYFGAAFDDFTPGELAEAMVDMSRRQTIEMLTGASVDVSFFTPIKQQMINAVEAGASRVEMINAIRQVAIGTDKVEGRLLTYAKQIAHDAFAMSDRSYANTIGTDLNIEWYFYSGDKIDTSREFCIARHNKYYHKKEVEAWAGLKGWDGRMRGTNKRTIFITAGGYQCRHSIIPVSISAVPPSVIERNKKNGNYK